MCIWGGVHYSVKPTTQGGLGVLAITSKSPLPFSVYIRSHAWLTNSVLQRMLLGRHIFLCIITKSSYLSLTVFRYTPAVHRFAILICIRVFFFIVAPCSFIFPFSQSEKMQSRIYLVRHCRKHLIGFILAASQALQLHERSGAWMGKQGTPKKIMVLCCRRFYPRLVIIRHLQYSAHKGLPL